MKGLILFCGLPGVGKSTISQRISREIGAPMVDIDDFKRNEVDSALLTTQIDPPLVRWGYYKRALEHTFSLFQDDTSSTIIMDEVFHLEELRQKITELCLARSVRVFWVEVQCPYDVVKKRLETHSREGHVLSTDEALKMNRLFAEIFQDFSDGHHHLVIINDDSANIDLIAQEILERVS